MTKEQIKSALESILFVWGDPLESRTAADLFNIPTSEMTAILRDLARDYEDRGSGLRIREMDKSFQLCTAMENDDYIKLLCTPVKNKKLTQPALETLAIIAYKQPVTKAQIDAVRGIKSDRVIEGLMGKGLIEERGRSTAIGRPYLYGTTKEFLKLFGFESLKDLPEIENIDDLIMEEEGFGIEDPDQLTIPLDEDGGDAGLETNNETEEQKVEEQ